jgi:hypothetical protein
VLYDSTGPKNARYIAKYNGIWSLVGNTNVNSGTSTNNGTNNKVLAIAVIDASNIYVGGTFRRVYDSSGTTFANYIAKYNTITSLWSLLGNTGKGIANNTTNGASSEVRAITVSGTDIYLGGAFGGVYDSTGFKSTGYIAKYNGSSWLQLGGKVSGGAVNTIAVSGTDIYVGGEFTDVSDSSGTKKASQFAKLNESLWTLASPIGDGSQYVNSVNNIVIVSNEIYIGTYSNILLYNFQNPNPIWDSCGTNNKVLAIAVSGTDIYVGGDFTAVYDSTGTKYANRIAKYNGSWSLVGNTGSGTLNNTTNGASDIVNTIVVSGTDIYVGGSFTAVYDSTGTKYANRIAKYNGSWSLVGNTGSGTSSNTTNGTSDIVKAIAVSGTDIYVGGSFTAVYDSTGTKYANRIAKYNGSWSLLGNTGSGTGNINGNNGTGDVYETSAVSVNTIAVIDASNIYVGGSFTAVYDSEGKLKYTNYIAKYNGSLWSFVGFNNNYNGTGDIVNTIVVSGTDIYVGGDFTAVRDRNGIIYANKIAKYNGSLWSFVGNTDTGSGTASNTTNGTSGSVNIIHINKYIYIGGLFNKIYNYMGIDGAIVNNICIL